MVTPAPEKVDRLGKFFTYITRTVGLLGVINFFVLLDLGRDVNPLIISTVASLAVIGEAVDRVVKAIKQKPPG